MRFFWLLLFSLFFCGISLKGQSTNLSAQEVSTIEDATNIILKNIEKITKTDKVIISYEYIYDLNKIDLSEKIFVKKNEYDLNFMKKNESLFILKISIDVGKNINIIPSLFRGVKHRKNHFELTNIPIQSSDFFISRKN